MAKQTNSDSSLIELPRKIGFGRNYWEFIEEQKNAVVYRKYGRGDEEFYIKDNKEIWIREDLVKEDYPLLKKLLLGYIKIVPEEEYDPQKYLNYLENMLGIKREPFRFVK